MENNWLFTSDGKHRVVNFLELKQEIKLQWQALDGVNMAETRIWSIKFDLPSKGYAVMHVQKLGSTEFIIECMTWEETKLIRKLVKFGSNHDPKERPLFWSGPFPIPTVGSHVHVFMNGLGDGTVLGYQKAEGYLAIMVGLNNPPYWYLSNCDGINKPAILFGTDLIDHSGKEVG